MLGNKAEKTSSEEKKEGTSSFNVWQSTNQFFMSLYSVIDTIDNDFYMQDIDHWFNALQIAFYKIYYLINEKFKTETQDIENRLNEIDQDIKKLTPHQIDQNRVHDIKYQEVIQKLRLITKDFYSLLHRSNLIFQERTRIGILEMMSISMGEKHEEKEETTLPELPPEPTPSIETPKDLPIIPGA